MSVLCADLGGTKLRVRRVGASGAVEAEEVGPTPADPEGFVARLRALAPGAARAVLGVPGRVDHARGRVEHAPNLPAAWAPALTEVGLAEALGVPVALANDADLAAVGEAAFGAGRGVDDLVFVTLSTGVGAGVILGRRLVRGRRSIAEAGHHVLDLGAWARGLPHTFEHLASGTGLARTAAFLGGAGDGAEVVAAAGAGDPVAGAALDAAITAAAVGVRNLAYLFSPERVVIGGGFGLVGERLYGPIRAELAAAGPPGLAIEVVRAELGDAAGLWGALAWEAYAPPMPRS